MIYPRGKVRSLTIIVNNSQRVGKDIRHLLTEVRLEGIETGFFS
jgi:hypothetical protein